MADSDVSGGGGGEMSPFLAYGFDDLKAMLDAEDPEAVSKHAAEWTQLGRDMATFVDMLSDERGFLDLVYSSSEGAPAVMRELQARLEQLGAVAEKATQNGLMLDTAAAALRTAKTKMIALDATGIIGDRSPRGPMATNAIPVMDELAGVYEVIGRNLGFAPPTDDIEPTSGNEPGGPESSVTKDVYGPSGGTTAPVGLGPGMAGVTAPLLGGGRQGGYRPGGPGPSPGRAPSHGGTTGTAPTAPAARTTTTTTGSGTGSGVGTGAAGGRALRVPGARSATPIGGYRPATTPPPSGTAPAGPGQGTSGAPGGPGGPGQPARPGMGGPGGAGGGPGGGDRQQKKTQYEKLEYNTFRDTRHRVKPVIGEQRRQPDVFTPTPGAIGGETKSTQDQAPKVPDLPTAQAPARFEGHDVSFARRTSGST